MSNALVDGRSSHATGPRDMSKHVVNDNSS